MARVDLLLFGGFVLRGGTRPRPLPARKAQALLAYLALRSGRPHARESLMGLLWGDTGDKQARQSLRQTLVRLRRALAGPGRAALVAQGDTVTLTPAALDVDVTRFERLVRGGTVEALALAVALYRGPLLDGCRVAEKPFEEWLESERARLHELALDALRTLMDRHVKAGRIDAAVQTAVRLVGLDSLQEDVHRELMRLYARQGRRAAALRQYQSCVTLLQKDLGVEPEPETKRLYLEILQRAAPGPGGARGARSPGAGAPRPALAPSDTPLIGREAELARLHRCLAATWKGRGAVVLLTGEPGIGKSRLVEELAATAAARGARALIGRGYESEQTLPFRPWVDALRTGRALAALSEPGRSSPGRGDLARLFPELAGQGAPPAITAENHLRLFESVDGVIHDLADRTPTVVIIEDLHWADEMTLRLFAFVGRRLADRSVLLVGTVREGEETAALQRVIGEVAALPHAEHVALAGLSAHATAALVKALARPGSGDARLAELTGKVWALSEGSPFVIVETIRALRDGRLPEAADVALPQRVREMIGARIGRLSPRAQELARVASAFTREFEFAVLRRAAGLGRRETAEGLEELVRRRILDAVGENFDFTHARIRQAVYQGLLGPRRQAMHAAIGDAVEAVYAGQLDEFYDRLAYHFSRAEEPERALAYTVRLADKVARRHALDEAARTLRGALAYTDRLPAAGRGRSRLEVVYRLAHVLSLEGRSAEARDLLVDHEPLVVDLRDPELTGVHYFWLAYAHGNLGDSETAYRHAKRALEEAARSGDEVTMGKASYELARETYVIGRPAEGIAHGRQALGLLERTDERWWLGQALWTLALLLLHVGDFAPALELTARLRDLGEATGERRLQAYAATIAGRVYTVMGETDDAVVVTRHSIELALDPVARAIAHGHAGAAQLEAGGADEAIALLEAATGELGVIGSSGGYRNRQIGSWFTALLAEAYLVKGDVEHADALTATARATAAGAGWPVGVGYVHRAAAGVARTLGKLPDAESAARQAIDTFEACGASAQVARSRLSLAEVLADAGDAAAAAREVAAARDAFVRMRAPRLVERADRLAQRLGPGPA